MTAPIYYKYAVHHTVLQEDIPELTKNAEPLPFPILSKEAYLETLTDAESDTFQDIKIIEDVDMSEKEYEFFHRNGKYLKRETRFYPVNCVGKIFCNVGTLGSTSSGAMIAKNLVLTAGHCVFKGNSGSNNSPYRNIIFQPSHPDHGVWYRVKNIYVKSSWVTNGDYSSDLAICEMETEMSINDYWGIQTRIGDSKHGWGVYGYPAQPPFDGVYPYSDGGTLTDEPWGRGNRLRFNLSATDLIDLTPGCSGGPWKTNGRVNGGNFILQGKDTMYGRPFHINGVNSFMFEDSPGCMISPSFGLDAEIFFKAVLADVEFKP